MSILEHHFPPVVAEKYGVNAAILLRDIYHWCETNRNNDENFYEGRWWTYQTIKGLCARHKYWTKNQIEYIIQTCREKGALLTGHFGENQFDRTCWYALTDEAMAVFDGPASISENSEIDSKEIPELNRKIPKCNIDKYKTKDKTYTPKAPKAASPDWAMFDRFWSAYPRKRNKEAARKAWKKINPDAGLCRIMSAALERDKQSREWKKDDGEYIPYASSWLNGRRWEDEDSSPPPDSGPVQPLRGEGVEYL